MIAFLIDPFPNVVLMDFEGVGYVAHDVCDQDSVLLVRPFAPIKMSLNVTLIFKNNNQRIFDLHCPLPCGRSACRQLLGAFGGTHYGFDQRDAEAAFF